MCIRTAGLLKAEKAMGKHVYASYIHVYSTGELDKFPRTGHYKGGLWNRLAEKSLDQQAQKEASKAYRGDSSVQMPVLGRFGDGATDLATRASLAIGLSSPTCSTSLGTLYEAAEQGL